MNDHVRIGLPIDLTFAASSKRFCRLQLTGFGTRGLALATFQAALGWGTRMLLAYLTRIL